MVNNPPPYKQTLAYSTCRWQDTKTEFRSPFYRKMRCSFFIAPREKNGEKWALLLTVCVHRADERLEFSEGRAFPHLKQDPAQLVRRYHAVPILVEHGKRIKELYI